MHKLSVMSSADTVNIFMNLIFYHVMLIQLAICMHMCVVCLSITIRCSIKIAKLVIK